MSLFGSGRQLTGLTERNRELENDFYGRYSDGGEGFRPALYLVDPITSQQWLESKGQYPAGEQTPASTLGKHDLVHFVVRIPQTNYWVLVAMYNNGGKRIAFIFNFDGRTAVLPEIHFMMNKLDTSVRPTYLYPQVSRLITVPWFGC